MAIHLRFVHPRTCHLLTDGTKPFTDGVVKQPLQADIVLLTRTMVHTVGPTCMVGGSRLFTGVINPDHLQTPLTRRLRAACVHPSPIKSTVDGG